MSRLTRWLFLVTILLSAAGLRFWRLDRLPPGFHRDEAYEGLEAWHIFTDSSYRPVFLTGNAGVPPLNAYANALMFGLFRWFGGEAGPVAMRVTAACFGVLGVLALYALATEIQQLDLPEARLSVAFPFFAAASLAVMRWHFHFSRMGIEPILTPLLWAGATWLLLRGWRKADWLSFAGCGGLVAGAMYAYQAAWIIPLLITLVVVLLLRQSRQNHAHQVTVGWRRKGGIMLTLCVAVLLFAPLGWFFWQHWNLMTLRPRQVSVLNNSDAMRDSSLGSNLWAAVKMFNPLGAAGDTNARRNIPGAPALNGWQAIAFYLGLGLALWRARWPSYALVLLGLVGLLLPGIFSNYVPHFHRLLGASAPVALLCGIGLDWLWQWPGQTTDDGRRMMQTTEHWLSVVQPLHWLSLSLLLFGGVTAGQEYFVRWAHLPALYYDFDVGFWQIARQIGQLPPDLPVYLTPRAAEHPTLAFALQTAQRPAPVTFDGRYILPLLAQVSPQPELYVVIEHDDARTRQRLSEIFPTATIEQTWLDTQGQVYAHAYVRPANAVPQLSPQHPLVATLGDGIALLGYAVQPAPLHAGDRLTLQLQWLVQAAPTTNWTVFVRLVNQAVVGKTRVVVEQKSRPGNGSLHTDHWRSGWRILDEYQLRLPVGLSPGAYTLEIELANKNGQHLPLAGNGVTLGVVKLE